MPSSDGTHASGAVREAAAHTVQLLRLEIELLLLELRKKALSAAIGAALGLLAVLLAPLVVIFLLAAAAAALATDMSAWLAILVVTGALVIVVGALVIAAVVLTRATFRRAQAE